MTKSEVVTNIFDEIAPIQGQEIDIWGDAYLPVQWQNLLGKWEFPLEFWGGSMLEFEHEVVQVRHQSNMVDGFLLDSISIAPFAVKIHWGYKDSNGKYHMAPEPLDDVNPWRSRVHILALVKEAGSLTPTILTAGSNTGKHLLANIRQSQRRITNMLKRIEYGDRPTHLFWTEMIAGKPITVGDGEATSTICPPVAVAPANIYKMTPKVIAKYLTSIYVGHDIRDLFNDGLWDEGQEWAAKQPERLQLEDGNGGNDNVALPPATIEAAVLDDGTLWFPDLSGASIREMKNCGMSVPGLFNHQNHADRAFSKLMRDKHISERADNSIVWEAWRVELETRYADQEALKENQIREAELRAQTAMDEVEEDAEIPADFR